MGLLTSIAEGKYDDSLDRIAQAIRARKEELGAERFWQLQPGDKVRFVGTIRPTYLAGAPATVVGKKVKRIIVRLDHPVGRFRGDIRCMPNQIEVIKEG